MTAFTRWRLGRKRRLVMAVTCVPMPPFFLALPLRQMWLPLMGPVPVNSQIFAINHFPYKRKGEGSNKLRGCKHFLVGFEGFRRMGTETVNRRRSVRVPDGFTGRTFGGIVTAVRLR